MEGKITVGGTWPWLHPDKTERPLEGPVLLTMGTNPQAEMTTFSPLGKCKSLESAALGKSFSSEVQGPKKGFTFRKWYLQLESMWAVFPVTIMRESSMIDTGGTEAEGSLEVQEARCSRSILVCPLCKRVSRHAVVLNEGN